MDQFELPNVSGEIWEFTYKSHGELYIERSEYCGIEVKDGLNFYKFMPLEDEEALAIRWHLGGFDPGVNFNYPSGAPQKQSMRGNKLQALLISADIAASYLVDQW